MFPWELPPGGSWNWELEKEQGGEVCCLNNWVAPRRVVQKARPPTSKVKGFSLP